MKHHFTKPVIIYGSSNSFGNTREVVNLFNQDINAEIVNLNDLSFSYFDYEHKNSGDDFIPLMKKLIYTYETFIFVTPVYWYSMSGIMKVFFDRLTDLLSIEKETGRKLKGKNMFVISNTNSEIDFDFYLPFRFSADYLEMNYLGDKHYII